MDSGRRITVNITYLLLLMPRARTQQVASYRKLPIVLRGLKMKIQNSVVFISGASRGLGLAFAQEALRRGAKKVYAGVRNPTETNTPGVVQIKFDVTNPACIAAAATQCGDTTVLVNNAGLGRITSSTSIQP